MHANGDVIWRRPTYASSRLKPRGEWLALKPGAHEGYVSWERAEAIRAMVNDNVPASRHHGAPKTRRCPARRPPPLPALRPQADAPLHRDQSQHPALCLLAQPARQWRAAPYRLRWSAGRRCHRGRATTGSRAGRHRRRRRGSAASMRISLTSGPVACHAVSPPGVACRLPGTPSTIRSTGWRTVRWTVLRSAAAQPSQHDPGLLLRRQLPGRPADVLHHLPGGGSLPNGFVANLHSLTVTMSQEPSAAQSHQTLPPPLTSDTRRSVQCELRGRVGIEGIVAGGLVAGAVVCGGARREGAAANVGVARASGVEGAAGRRIVGIRQLGICIFRD